MALLLMFCSVTIRAECD
jgi:hypothetical protein